MKKFQVDRRTIKRFLEEDNLIETSNTRGASCKNMFPAVQFQQAQEAALRYINEARNAEIPTPIRMVDVLEKVRSVAHVLEGGQFKASNGWLQKLLRRHDFSTKRVKRILTILVVRRKWLS